MRVNIPAQDNNKSLWWGTNTRLTVGPLDKSLWWGTNTRLTVGPLGIKYDCIKGKNIYRLFGFETIEKKAHRIVYTLLTMW